MGPYLLLVLVGLAAGTMNAVAGGGSFVVFPALVAAGLPSVPANASSTVALFPGGLASVAAYRKDPIGLEGVSLLHLVAVTVVGSVIGAVLLLSTPSPVFDEIVPWLLLIATLVFSFGQRLGAELRKWVAIGPRTLLAVQFGLGIYSGYFGGGVSIMMLAAWSVLARTDIMRLNPTRTMIVNAGNAVAVVCFVLAREVRWPQTAAVLAGAVFGGYVGARIARRLPPKRLRGAIIIIGSTMTALFFLRAA
jgi:hypothetical protein